MSGGFKGQGMGGVISWLLSNKNSGGQSIGLAGVTGLKEHTILKALGFTGYIRVHGYNMGPWFTSFLSVTMVSLDPQCHNGPLATMDFWFHELSHCQQQFHSITLDSLFHEIL